MVTVAPKTSALQQLLRRVADVWRPRSLPSTPEWTVKHVRLPSEISANPGGFDLEERPYMREPLACMDDPEIEEIDIVGSAQVGKTVWLVATVQSRMDLGPAPGMLIGPNQDHMRELRDKVYAYCEASPTLANRIPSVSRRNDRYLEFDTMLVYLAYCGSAERLRGRTCKYVWGTEVDVWQDDPILGDPVQVARARMIAWEESKIIFESTPSDDASRIEALYKNSDQRAYNCPCPHCGTYQELRFFEHKSGKYAGRGGVRGIKDEHGEFRKPDDVAPHVWYQCIACDVPIRNEDKTRMIERGVWCPRGCTVNERGQLEGKPERDKRVTGFRLWSVMAPHITFAQIAREYLIAKQKGQLKVFFNNWLGLPFKVSSVLPEWRKFGLRQRVPYYVTGFVPSQAYFLTCGVDVQGDRLYYAVRAWGHEKTSWSIERGCLRPEQLGIDSELRRYADQHAIAHDLVQLFPRIIRRRWEVMAKRTNPLGLTSLNVRLLGSDSQYRTAQVQQFVRAAKTNPHNTLVYALRGDHTRGPQELIKHSHVERNARTGKKYEGGLDVWGIAVSAYKEDLLQRYEIPSDRPGAWLLPSDILHGGEDYLRQLVNEAPQVLKKEGERDKVKWTVIDAGVGNHYWDCEVYASALADLVVGRSANAWDLDHRADWHAAARQQRQHTEQQDIARERAARDDEISAR